MSDTNTESVDKYRNDLFSSFLDIYKMHSNFIRKLPIPENLKQIILTRLDDSYLWTKESFLMLSLAIPTPIVSDEPHLQEVKTDANILQELDPA